MLADGSVGDTASQGGWRWGSNQAAEVSETEYTSSIEDYLKTIYELSRETGAGGGSDVALRLDVTRASVSGMMRRLAEQELVEHKPYGELRLTAAGRAIALRLLRRHRVIETYLVTVLGYRWDLVHGEAERLEHAASDELVDRMAAALGEPVVDPHGAPIPSRSGAVVEPVLRPLAELQAGEEAQVARVQDYDPALLRHLATLDLLPGARVTCVERDAGGTLSIRVGSRVHARSCA